MILWVKQWSERTRKKLVRCWAVIISLSTCCFEVLWWGVGIGAVEVQWRKSYQSWNVKVKPCTCPCVPCFCFNIYFYILAWLCQDLVAACGIFSFLVVQWLTLWMPNAEGPGSISGWKTRSHMLQLRVPCLLRLTPELIGKCEDVETKNIYGGGGGDGNSLDYRSDM